MKKFTYGVVIALLIGFIPATIAATKFYDVIENSWYGNAVTRLSDLNIIQGYEDYTFKPDKNVNRAEMAVIIDRLLTYIQTGKTPDKKPVSEKLIYSDDSLNISFLYPKTWGEITKNKDLDQIQVYVKGLEKNPVNFLVADNPNFEPLGRGGYWGDWGSQIKNESDVNNFCLDKSNCKIFTNANGIKIAKYVNTEQIMMNEPKTHVDYYLFNKYSLYQGVIISTIDFLEYDYAKLTKEIEELVFSIDFVKDSSYAIKSHFDDKLNISFDYPEVFGELKSNTDWEIYTLAENSGKSFLAANNPNIESPGRGGFWGDTGKTIKSKNDIVQFCSDKIDETNAGTNGCQILVNKAGITIAKYLNSRCLSEGCSEEKQHIEYYFFNEKSDFSGSVLSTTELFNLSLTQAEEYLDMLSGTIEYEE